MFFQSGGDARSSRNHRLMADKPPACLYDTTVEEDVRYSEAFCLGYDI